MATHAGSAQDRGNVTEGHDIAEDFGLKSEVTTREITNDVVVEADTSDILKASVTKDEQDPKVDAASTGFGKHVKPVGVEFTGSAHVYDPHTGVYFDPQTGHVSSLGVDERQLDEESARKHERAAEREKKLETPSCDHCRMSARIAIHGATTCPHVSKSVKTDDTGLPKIGIANLERVVTTGLTETADLSLNDMAACAFGVVDVQTEPIMSVPSTIAKSRSTDITQLPSTTTLLRKRHIIPELLDSVEENGISLEVHFRNVQIFNGLIVDRALMHEAPVIKLITMTEITNPFLLLLIELEGDDLVPGSDDDFLQWMLHDLTTEKGGRELIKYTQKPYSKKDRHKHVLLLFPQLRELDESRVTSRCKFDVHEFIVENHLGAATAAVYFESETCNTTMFI